MLKTKSNFREERVVSRQRSITKGSQGRKQEQKPRRRLLTGLCPGLLPLAHALLAFLRNPGPPAQGDPAQSGLSPPTSGISRDGRPRTWPQASLIYTSPQQRPLLPRRLSCVELAIKTNQDRSLPMSFSHALPVV